MDATESPIERPPKKQRRYYSGKKKRHTLKTQVLVNLKDGQIICLAFANGRKHDFRLFKESHTHVWPDTLLEEDTGYLGLTDLHSNSSLPKKTFQEASVDKARTPEKQRDFPMSKR